MTTKAMIDEDDIEEITELNQRRKPIAKVIDEGFQIDENGFVPVSISIGGYGLHSAPSKTVRLDSEKLQNLLIEELTHLDVKLQNLGFKSSFQPSPIPEQEASSDE